MSERILRHASPCDETLYEIVHNGVRVLACPVHGRVTPLPQDDARSGEQR